MGAIIDTHISTDSDTRFVENILKESGPQRQALIPILQKIQHEYRYLPQHLLEYLADNSENSPADIMESASFYSMFRLKPAGRHTISVCAGTACHIKGADLIFDSFKQFLQIKGENDTDRQRLFTVEKVACLGCCAIAPAIRIDDDITGFVTTKKIPSIIRQFKTKEKHGLFLPVSGDVKNKDNYAVIHICLCSACSAAGASVLWQHLDEIISQHNLPFIIKSVGCTGESHKSPLMEILNIRGDVKRYSRPKKHLLKDILYKNSESQTASWNFRNRVSKTINNLASLYTGYEAVQPHEEDLKTDLFQNLQVNIATEFAGRLSPLDIEEYQDNGGLTALNRVLAKTCSRQNIIKIIKQSCLRGRGGAGFPTGAKIEAVRNCPSTPKYIILNGDEGDPGAFMDRLLLESYPFKILEGMMIIAISAGIEIGFLYIRDEYRGALKRINKAIDIFYKKGLLGKNISNSGFSLDLSVVRGAGAYICGEETALIASIEGKRGTPSLKPPYPSESGFDNKPTLVNNVETFSLIPWIINNGSHHFSKIGSKTSRGTKTFALAGKIKNQGLIEVPMGMSLKQIIDDIGKGCDNGKMPKAIQTGGPSGGCIPYHMTDIPIDYEALISSGSFMGSGGLIVLDETDCMVDIARYFLEFTKDESCGKCTFCRIGTVRMLEILERLVNGKGEKGDIERLEALSHMIKKASLCGLGKAAPNPVLSSIRHFRNEYEDHINGVCTAKKCKAMILLTITKDCIGCNLCAGVCPVGAVSSKPYEEHVIDVEKCIKCESCKNICPENAVLKENAAMKEDAVQPRKKR